MLFNCGVGEDSWESHGLQGDPASPSQRKSVLNIHWKDWCWSWNTNTMATWCKELTHWKRPWCWERLKAGGEVDDRGFNGWKVSLTRWTWVWASSGSWWWTGKPGVLPSMGLQRVRHDWATELNWHIILLSNHVIVDIHWPEEIISKEANMYICWNNKNQKNYELLKQVWHTAAVDQIQYSSQFYT